MVGARPGGETVSMQRMREGLVAAGRGVVLAGWSLVGLGALTALVGALSLIPLGVGVYLVPATVMMVRRCADQSRRWAEQWSHIPIDSPYRRQAAPRGGFVDNARRTATLITDPATYRDVAWLVLNPIVGLGLAVLPATLILHSLWSFAYPFVWQSLAEAGDWYLIFPASRAVSVVALPLGVLSLFVGVWAAPVLLRVHGRFTRWLLGPPSGAELASRVEHLARTRSEAVDTQAAELRRIERDLHDGAQARLVAMGMTLSTAEQLLEADPQAARLLLAEARETSAKALHELRDLVRGIHPPVLADRGLVDAVRALALDSPLSVEVEAAYSGRLPLPIESAAYFAVSELLSNATKHAEARRVTVALHHSGDRLRITVTDDGRGGADLNEGTGLRGIARRLATFDGTLSLSSPQGGPTTATMEVPCELSSPKISSS